MELKDNFILNCKKILIFRKEYLGYVVFDPVNLDYYIMNDVAAEIMYMISEELSYIQMFDYYNKIYSITEDEFKSTLNDFFCTSPFFNIIYPNLIKNGVAKKCLI